MWTLARGYQPSGYDFASLLLVMEEVMAPRSQDDKQDDVPFKSGDLPVRYLK